MKRIASEILLMLLLVSLSISVLIFAVGIYPVKADETIIFQDDFENYNVGDFPSTGGWELVFNGRGDEYQIVTGTVSFSGSKSFQLWGYPNWAACAQKSFSSTSPVIGYEFAIMMDAVGTGGPCRDNHPGFWNREARIWGKYYATVRFNHDDLKIYADDRTVLGEWKPRVWYHIKVILDRNINKYTVWINGELRGENLTPENPDTELINALVLNSDHPAVKVYYDDVKVFEVWRLAAPWWVQHQLWIIAGVVVTVATATATVALIRKRKSLQNFIRIFNKIDVRGKAGLSEDPLRKSARSLAAASLLIFAISVLIVVISTIVMIAVLSAALRPTAVPITATAAAGLILIDIGIIIYIIFALYAGFKGRSVVLRTDLAGWEATIRNLGGLYFSATLFLVVGMFLIPGTYMLYQAMVLSLISSILLMISAMIIPSQTQSITAGILVIIAAILSMLVKVPVKVPDLEHVGFFQVLSMLFLSGTLFTAALIIVGIALILRGTILRPPIYNTVAAVGGVVFAADLAYFGFSLTSLLSWLPSPTDVPSPAASAYWTFYWTWLAGSSLIGISGIIGLVALICAIIFIVKSGFPAIMRVGIPPPVAPPTPPTKPSRYCPSCGSPVDPEDTYCSNCGRKLK